MKKLLGISYRKLLFLAAASLLSVAGIGQTAADYLKAADNFFKEGDYYSAAMYYERYLKGDTAARKSAYNPYVVQHVSNKIVVANPASRKQIIYKLAESYRLIKYYAKAEPYYQEAIPLTGEFPLAAYWYAKCLKANDKQTEAETAFNDLVTTYTIDDEYLKDIKRELNNIQFAKAEMKKKDLYKFKVNKMDATVNQSGASYASTVLNDGAVVFTTTRPDTGMAVVKGVNPYTNKLIKSTATGGSLTDQQKIELASEKDWEQGVASFSSDGNKMFVTRWTTQNGKKTSAIYYADKNMTGWSAPVKLGDMVNMDGFSSQQPFASPDGKSLLFSSDRTGGSGKFDLWSVDLDASFMPAGAATNLGTAINTDADDEAPFYHQPSQTLVFASNGRAGMGGLDLFYAKGNLSNWETPKNMGYPVNSVRDDIYYNSSDKKTIWNNAYLSSDRNSPCCLELFAFDKVKTMKTINGMVVDCEGKAPVAGASVSVTAADGSTVFNKTTDANGRYQLTIEDYQALKINAASPGYNSNSITVAVPDDVEKEMMTNPDICLTKPPVIPDTIGVNVPVVLDNVLYKFNKYALTPESYPSLDKLVKLMQDNPGMAIELSSHTDNVGADSYNQSLSEKRAISCVNYLVSKGIDASRIETKGYGESQPVAPNTKNGRDNPEGRKQNRRTEFKILHY